MTEEHEITKKLARCLNEFLTVNNILRCFFLVW